MLNKTLSAKTRKNKINVQFIVHFTIKFDTPSIKFPF